MRKTLPIEEQKLFELFGNFTYKLPKDPELMLYDFYFMTSFGPEVGGANLNANYAIEEGIEDVVNALHRHMKDAVFFALCAEIRHLFDMYHLVEIEKQITRDQLEFLQEYYKELKMLLGAHDQTLRALGIDDILKTSPRDRALLADETVTNRLRSHKAVKNVMKRMGWGRADFALFAEAAFKAKGWQSSYGGKPWAAIGKALYKLEIAKTQQQKTIWIDHAYDLQHNTDTVFNKLKIYMKDSGFGWIKKALDWKRDVTDYRDFYNRVSGQLKGMVAYISKTRTGKTIGDLASDANDAAMATTGLAIPPNPHSSSKFDIGDGVKVKFVGMAMTSSPSMAIDEAGMTNYHVGVLPEEDKIYTVIWNSPGSSVGIEDDISGDQFLIKAKGLILSLTMPDASSPSPQLRTTNSNQYKFDYGQKVKIISNLGLLPVDGNVKNWGQENGYSLSSSITHVDKSSVFEVQATGENDYYPGKTVCIIRPLEGPHLDESYLIDQDALSKIQSRAELDFKFEIGQTVKVISQIKAYTHYNAWANEHDFQLDSTDEPSRDAVYQIIARGPHEYNGHKLYGIKDINGIHFIMDEEGLKIYSAGGDFPIATPDDDSDDVPTGPVRTRPSDGSFVDISGYSSNWVNVQLDSSVYDYIVNNVGKYKWLLAASINSAKLSLGDDGKLLWLSGNWNHGIWKNGTWDSGEWIDGIWKNGIWNYGTWFEGFWSNGIWKGGVHHNGEWRKGTWHKGTWRGGVWEDGYWKSGVWENGTWLGGKWKTGSWIMGEIADDTGIPVYSTDAPGL